jgi:hypothetical protein
VIPRKACYAQKIKKHFEYRDHGKGGEFKGGKKTLVLLVLNRHRHEQASLTVALLHSIADRRERHSRPGSFRPDRKARGNLAENIKKRKGQLIEFVKLLVPQKDRES